MKSVENSTFEINTAYVLVYEGSYLARYGNTHTPQAPSRSQAGCLARMDKDSKNGVDQICKKEKKRRPLKSF